LSALRLEPPETVSGKLFSSNVSTLVVLHLLALFAFVPWLFSWTGVVLVFVGNFVFGSLGINIGYHRLLTHRSFQCPKWLERTFALCGICALQDSPIHWVAAHRMHHQHADTHPDPHSPLVNFLWGHFGWLVFKNRQLRKRSTLAKYAPDLLRDPFHARLHRHRVWLWVYVVHAALYLGAGCAAGWVMTRTAAGALQFGLSVLVWGVVVRTVYTWHVTWAVNSVTHLWGYRNYETGENSRNNWIVALLTHGEGWHNNHHADQRSARHGHRWWEFDPIYWTILLLRAAGLATNVLAPNRTAMPVVRSNTSTMRTTHRADSPHALPRRSLSSTEPDGSRSRSAADSPAQNQ
jgi:stearoyl-CoA desaturase (delta-9 desaturase)